MRGVRVTAPGQAQDRRHAGRAHRPARRALSLDRRPARGSTDAGRGHRPRGHRRRLRLGHAGPPRHDPPPEPTARRCCGEALRPLADRGAGAAPASGLLRAVRVGPSIQGHVWEGAAAAHRGAALLLDRWRCAACRRSTGAARAMPGRRMAAPQPARRSAGREHLVLPGETLSEVAERYRAGPQPTGPGQRHRSRPTRSIAGQIIVLPGPTRPHGRCAPRRSAAATRWPPSPPATS